MSSFQYKKEELLVKYRKLLTKFVRRKYVSSYMEIDHCKNGNPITMYFTDKFKTELAQVFDLKESDLSKLMISILDIRSATFKTDEQHKKLAFEAGWQVE